MAMTMIYSQCRLLLPDDSSASSRHMRDSRRECSFLRVEQRVAALQNATQ